MAKAVKATKRVAKMTYTDEEVINLQLSRREADALMAVCADIAGPPEGLRGVFSDCPDSLLVVLQEALGIHYSETDAYFYKKPGSLYFNLNSRKAS